MNVAHLLLRSARVHPDHPAVIVGNAARQDYRTLARRASALGASLRTRLGLVPGDRVALLAHNGAAYLELLHAAWIAGLVAVPINSKLHPREVAFIVADSGTRALFVSPALAADLAPALADVPSLRHVVEIDGRDYERLVGDDALAVAEAGRDDVAWLFYTSGTTGRPKGVMLTHGNLLAMTLCYFTDVDTALAGDAVLYAAPMSHGAGLYVLPNMRAAARHVIPESRGFDAAEFLALAAHHGSATAFAAPTMVKRLVDHAAATGQPGTGLRTIVYGGGPMYLADIERAQEVLGNRFVQIYGQGESPMTITALSRAHHADRDHPRRAARLASVGVPHTAVEVRIVGDDGRTLPAGEVGEVTVRGAPVMRGYWENAAATAQALQDGWLRTGDVGALDDDGFLTLKDRSKDVIISGGANIYPREVEEALLRHPGVDEACVVGRPDQDWGEAVVAFVVRRPGTTVDEAALDRICLDHIARFKRPKAYVFVAALPKNNYGKVLKREVRRWMEDDAAPS
jgi:long-chain acyl-CoA synthetase